MFLDRLLFPMQHCEDAAAHLLLYLNVKFTRSNLQRELQEHPNYPSMLSIADVIGSSYSVSSIPLTFTRDEILSEPEIQPPFIAHIRTERSGDVFGAVSKFSADSIEMYNPDSRKKEKLSPEEFNKLYRGTILMARGEENAAEREYEKHLKEERQRSAVYKIIAFAFPVLALLACISTVISQPSAAVISPVLFTLITLMGCIVTALLLWHEVDEYNPVVQQICQTSTKVNCSAILHSKASKIFGLSWSSLGFSYFMGMLLTLIMTGIQNPASLTLLSWINVLAVPYIAFSVYYQWKVARQWCVLCLMVQGVLLLQFITALSGGFHTLLPFDQIPLQSYLALAGASMILAMAIQLLMPALEKAKEGRTKKTEIKRLKNNPKVFETLLAKQKSIVKPADSMGITIGNPDGIYKLIKVCNPYCGPCAQVHPAMEALVENNGEICLQVLFTASLDDSDLRKFPVSHFLAIDTKKNEPLTKKALDDWYNMPENIYVVFGAKYPLIGVLQLEED